MRIHLGHHFYGAGNLGDDFMLAGFLAAMRTLEPRATYTCCVPFALEPLRQRFPQVDWRPYDSGERERAITAGDVWLGLGGSPFQSAQSRWFVDHLAGEAQLCTRAEKPMFYLGVGVQTATELSVPDVRRLCAQAAGIWTRDAGSAAKLSSLPAPPRHLEIGADLAHVFFRDNPPPAAVADRVTLVANFDYGAWAGQASFLLALGALPASEHVWLAQESRELPGAERALHAALPQAEKSRWKLVAPEVPGAALTNVFSKWPSGGWLVTARFHAALAGAWARSRIVVISTNEKLRAASRELGCPAVPPDADTATVARALESARPTSPPVAAAERAYEACRDFVRAASAASHVNRAT